MTGSQSSAARVGIVCGSRSDFPVMEKAVELLDALQIPCELRAISAHRAPDLLDRFVAGAEASGIRVFIAGAGGAAHLPGVIAARTTLPVIGVPIPTQVAGGLDSLLSIVQMPKGVPVATVGVGGAENAALLAAEILALGDPALRARVAAHREAQARAIESDASNAGLTGPPRPGAGEPPRPGAGEPPRSGAGR
jgi:5-(carboxyamino)imidazole ribonucleotide mutase